MEMEAPTGELEEAVAVAEVEVDEAVVATVLSAAVAAGAAVAAAAQDAVKPERPPALLSLKKLSELPRVDAGRITPRTSTAPHPPMPLQMTSR
jgi:hypothetical protein